MRAVGSRTAHAVIVPAADLSYAYDIVLEKAGIYRFVILFSQAWSAVMLKKLLMLCLALMLSVGHAFAAVDVNTADQAALDSVKGLDPVKSKAIVDECTKNGPFKDADDLANRVKGLDTKSVAKLEENGLTIGGSSAPPTGKGSKTSTSTSTTSATKSTAANSMSNSSGGSAAPNSIVKSSTAATTATSPAINHGADARRDAGFEHESIEKEEQGIDERCCIGQHRRKRCEAGKVQAQQEGQGRERSSRESVMLLSRSVDGGDPRCVSVVQAPVLHVCRRYQGIARDSNPATSRSETAMSLLDILASYLGNSLPQQDSQPQSGQATLIAAACSSSTISRAVSRACWSASSSMARATSCNRGSAMARTSRSIPAH